MNSRAFVIGSIVLTAIIFPLYFVAIDLWLIKDDHNLSFNYKKFLIDNLSGNKILIDSGSNSIFGIDPIQMERHFNVPVINMADNAGFPIKHKFYYLTKYANKGDVIILPLEWHHYVSKVYPDLYVVKVLNNNLAYYYENLPFSERVDMIYKHTPLSIFFKGVAKKIKGYNFKDRITNYFDLVKPNKSYSFGSAYLKVEAGKEDNRQENISCDQYLFNEYKTKGFVIGKNFYEAMDVLKKAVDKGVKVVFTWPVVVDKKNSKCYSSDFVLDNIYKFTSELREKLTSYGFMVIGDFRDNHMPNEYFLDTPYHVTDKGSEIRTRTLIRQMEEGHITIASKNYKPGDARDVLLRRLNILLASN